MISAMNKLMILYFLFAVMIPPQAIAGVIKVGKGQAIAGIQQGIDMATAGDTVLVAEGIYRQGNIIINKSIVLKGVGHPVLDGEKKYELLSIRSPNVTVDGFLIRNSGHSSMTDIAGIKIYNTHDITIVNNILEDNFFGIYSQQGRKCIIQNNRITASSIETQLSGNGIHCWKSDSMYISGNSIEGHRDGIYLEFATHSLVEKNTVQKNQRYGLHFMFSHDNTYTSNVFRNNGAGVAVMYTRNVTMKSNRFEDNWGDAAYGLLLKEISDSDIEGNYFEKNTSGIFMDGSSRIEMQKNVFKDNGWAIKMQALSVLPSVINKNNYNQFIPLLQQLINDTLAAPYVGYIVHNIKQYNAGVGKQILMQLVSKYASNKFVSDAVISNLENKEESFLKEVVKTNPAGIFLFRISNIFCCYNRAFIVP